jgi:hypothetical protein
MFIAAGSGGRVLASAAKTDEESEARLKRTAPVRGVIFMGLRRGSDARQTLWQRKKISRASIFGVAPGTPTVVSP